MNVDELSRQIEYKVAPAPLIVVQALANTYAFDTDEELLHDLPATRRWLTDSELTTPEVRVGDADRERLIGFRTVVRALVDANLTGEHDSRRHREFAEFAGAYPVPVAVGRAGEVGVDLDPAASTAELLGQMIGIVLTSQVDGTWPRLKICAADDCRWAFYDTTRNRGGTWCKMETCGNKVKNRAYRQRLASGA